MKEDLIYYLYQFYLRGEPLYTTDGEKIMIVAPGTRNMDSGPDYFNARVRIGSTLWAGNVEIHVRASDWFIHGHDNDPAYANIILHVVLEYNADIYRPGGEKVPCLQTKELLNRIDVSRFIDFQRNRQWIPCARLVNTIDPFFMMSWLNVLLVQRMERKYATIRELLGRVAFNWDEVALRRIFWSFGLRANAEQFLLISNKLSIELINFNRQDIGSMEALLFGIAGMLGESYKDTYYQHLKDIFRSQMERMNLVPVPSHLWNFKGSRPSGFPTIRIAQLADLLCSRESLFSVLYKTPDAMNADKQFICQASTYWDDHYIFGQSSKSFPKIAGKHFRQQVTVNGLVPLLFARGKASEDERMISRAMGILDQLPAEMNEQTRRWLEMGVCPESAFHSQALIELKEMYCDKRNCLNCRIGFILLKRNRQPRISNSTQTVTSG